MNGKKIQSFFSLSEKEKYKEIQDLIGFIKSNAIGCVLFKENIMRDKIKHK